MTESLTRSEIAAMAPMPLTRPGEDQVPIRMQTEHLYALEKNLASKGIPEDVISENFDQLHRLPVIPLDKWVAAVTDAYNATVQTHSEEEQ